MSEAIARKLHDLYEALAPSYGYETRKDTRDFDPRSPNGQLMIEVCSEVFGELTAEIERLRELLYKTTHSPYGWCNFSHLHNGGQCGECEACEHTKDVMKSVREALEGDDE